MDKRRTTVVSALVTLALLLISGMFIYHDIEGWSYVDALYFTTITVTTVGYGDLIPTTDASKLFTVFFALAGISLVLFILFNVGRYYMQTEQRSIRRILSKSIKRPAQLAFRKQFHKYIYRKK